MLFPFRVILYTILYNSDNLSVSTGDDMIVVHTWIWFRLFFIHPSALHSSVCLSVSLQWCHNERGSVSYHQSLFLLNCRFRRRSKETSKLRVTGLCAGNSPVTGTSPNKCPVTRKMFPFDDVIMMVLRVDFGRGETKLNYSKLFRDDIKPTKIWDFGFKKLSQLWIQTYMNYAKWVK